MNVDRLVLTDAFDELLRRVRLLVDADLRPRAAEWRKSGTDTDSFAVMGQAGLLGLPIAEGAGGGGCSFYDYFQVVEELATVWPSLALRVSSHDRAFAVLMSAGTPEQKARWLDGMLDGQTVAQLSTVDLPADPGQVEVDTNAVREARGYVLSGRRQRPDVIGRADIHALMARAISGGDQQLAWFFVPTSAFNERNEKSALPGDELSPLARQVTEFDNVRVPSANRLGTAGAGTQAGNNDVALAGLGVAAVATGVAHAALSAVMASLDRGGVSIDEDATALALADMATATEAARATYLSAAQTWDCGLSDRRLVTIARLLATENARKVTAQAGRVMTNLEDDSASLLRHLARQSAMLSGMYGGNHAHRLEMGRAYAPRPQVLAGLNE